MTNDYSTEADTVGDALDAVYLKNNQGSGNSGKYLKVDTDGSVICATGGGGAELVQTVTYGDTTHAPSGDAVYDFVTDLIGDAIAYIHQ